MGRRQKKSQGRRSRCAETLASPLNAPSKISIELISLGFALFALVLIAYFRTFSASYIWDDPQYLISNATLRDAQGLWEMWTHPNALPQWYPLVHTTFWIEYHLWGLESFAGYHATNVILHAISSIILWRILSRLKIPGAWLAAAIFAVHPVEVESVAWITERKNVLSLLLYLLALQCYLFRTRAGLRRRSIAPYLAALALFIAALLSKTVTATFPATVLVILWWKRGKLRARDFIRLIPFFVIGAGLSIFTAYLEVSHVGATGAKIKELNFTAVQRVFIAGRVIWFYSGKLVWPNDLTFIYPRWESIDRAAQWLWIFPIAIFGLMIALWRLRNRIGRGALAATLLFCGTLFPALGFLNVYPMRFSFAADHFQYHASIALIVLGAAMIWRTFEARRLQIATAIIIVAPLTLLTIHQTRIYANAETLWRDTLAKNKNSWMVYTNLGNALAAENRHDEAIPFYLRALELAPDLADTHWNVGVARMRENRLADAETEFKTAMRIDPQFAPAYDSLGKLYLLHQNNIAAAEMMYQKAMQLAPQWSDVQTDYAVLLERQQNWPAALEHYRAAVAANSQNLDARYNLGTLCLRMKFFDESLANLSEAVQIDPNYVEAWTNLGGAQLSTRHFDDAVISFRSALRLRPNFPPAAGGLRQAQAARAMVQ